MNQVQFSSVYQTGTAQGQFEIGQRAMTPDGREWQFALASEAIANSSAVIPAAVVDTDLWSSSTDNQGRIVYTNRAANSLTVGAYAQGIGVVNQGTGVGQTFKIRTNNATQLTLYPETALTTALAVADSDLQYIVMSKVRPAAITSKLQMCQGANQVAFANADYGWILTNGDGRGVVGNFTLVVGAGFTTGDDVVGQVQVSIITEGPLTAQNLGYAIVANDAADQGFLGRWITR